MPAIYPPAPEIAANTSLLTPSPELKRSAQKARRAIILFILAYLLLLVFGAMFAGLCMALGILLIVMIPSGFVLLFTVGFWGVGLMVLIFLIKFIFAKNKANLSGMIEVTEQSQPELFAFIRQVTQETQAPFPKRIYLNAEVNASVFYDSNFWSLFFPVRKNLLIGLGLVNSLNISEFKAVMAHEFGHFSQRTMKAGSYVYYINRVIYDLLYNNDNYGKWIDKWSNITWVFSLLSHIAIRVIQEIQNVLKKLYAYVNRQYLDLSRQMEFQADAVAAYVSGGNQLVAALYKLDVANVSYQQAINQLDQLIGRQQKTANFYQVHQVMLRWFAQKFDVPMVNGILKVERDVFAYLAKNRVRIEDQWASHPSNEDRDQALTALGLTTETLYTSPWQLFRNPEALQQRLTEQMYQQVQFESAPQVLLWEQIEERLQQETNYYMLPKPYLGYFDSHLPATTGKLPEGDELQTLQQQSLGEWFDAEKAALPSQLQYLFDDLQRLDQVKQEPTIRTFDLDGIKKNRKDVQQAIDQLTAEQQALGLRIQEVDQQFYRFFYAKSLAKGEADVWESKVGLLKQFEEELNELSSKSQEIYEIIAPLYQGGVSQEAANAIQKKLETLDVPIRAWAERLVPTPEWDTYILSAHSAQVKDFLANYKPYIGVTQVNDNALQALFATINGIQTVLQEQGFSAKKDLLVWQSALLEG